MIRSMKSGKNIIVNAQAVRADGINQLVFYDGSVGKAHPTNPAITHGYIDHHATCPQAKEWSAKAHSEQMKG